MEQVTLNKIYSKLEKLEGEITQMRYLLVPEVKISKKEEKELDAILNEMKAGKEKDWRDAFSK